ncbi:MAG: toxin HicA [Roseiflexus castenholzii]|uniref:type II toxin-antitoxin system HicA family toxin n=1 Tax=Roseiflexus castenholzii TaxID=120962 RepID=UPI000CB3178A|nr:MAG: toxin HicA [Roseiflexus castenholzii]
MSRQRRKKIKAFIDAVRGSHHHYKHPNKPGRVTIPHPKKDLPVGTLKSIYRQAGWFWSEKE